MLLFEARSELFEIHRNACMCASRSCSQILHWPGDGLPKFFGCSQRPIWVAQKFTRHQNRISFSGGDDLFGLNRRRNHSNRPGQNFRFLANLLRQTEFDNPVRPESLRAARCRLTNNRLDRRRAALTRARVQSIAADPSHPPPSRSRKCVRTTAPPSARKRGPP